MRPALLFALALSCVTALAPAADAADSFTPAQRDEIVRILRDTLKNDPAILRDALIGLQAEEERRQAQAMSDAVARLGSALISPADPVLGNPLGDVTMVEFYDTRCPYCRRMLPVVAELLQKEPGLKLVLKDLPVLGPASQLESRALLAAQLQGGYFKLQDALMHSSATPTRDSIRDMAGRVGLDPGKLMQDIDDPAIKARLDANVAMAHQIGIQGTPALIVGKQVIEGAVGLPELRQVIAEARKK